MKRTAICIGSGILALSLMADNYVYLTKNNVNLREAPSTTAPIVTKGKKGSVFLVEETKSGWYKGRSAQYGESPVWISTSVAGRPATDLENPAFAIVNLPTGVIPYVMIQRDSNGEVADTWIFTSPNPDFMQQSKPGASVEASNTVSLAKANGSLRTYITQYKGSAYPSYLLLTQESTDGGTTYNTLSEPIYVYPSMFSESGIYINGNHYIDDIAGDEEW